MDLIVPCMIRALFSINQHVSPFFICDPSFLKKIATLESDYFPVLLLHSRDVKKFIFTSIIIIRLYLVVNVNSPQDMTDYDMPVRLYLGFLGS